MLLAALCCLVVVAGEESLSWSSPEPETRQRRHTISRTAGRRTGEAGDHYHDDDGDDDDHDDGGDQSAAPPVGGPGDEAGHLALLHARIRPQLRHPAQVGRTDI